MPPLPGVDVDSMAPHSLFGLSRFPFDMFVSVAICSDCVSFPDEPFPDILAVTGYDPNRPSELVVVLDRDVNLPTADLPDQSALYLLSNFSIFLSGCKRGRFHALAGAPGTERGVGAGSVRDPRAGAQRLVRVPGSPPAGRRTERRG